ncbi:helix-turn-helix transcriptional regulator [Mycolicibacterium sp. S2-37]|uniref:AraC family transcriptional regulator n=1 Tax=Mycolicibacterium sp. S2-37 TaxID=2810297 RepID=UPI001A94B91F|nr:AraC family transcriptional regulator [Mycolicibacterium sp. S2-37]MBO0677826.1 helix-turn-helix transcriptional regulator [Mycolicibacterium sp. S2-37]
MATAIQHASWTTTDLGEACTRLETEFGARLRVGESRGNAKRLSVDKRGTEQFQCGTVRLPTQLHFDCADNDVIIVNTMQAGIIGGIGGLHDFAYRRGDVFLSNFPGAHYRCHTDHTAAHIVVLPTRFFLEAVGSSPALRFLSVNPVSADATKRWMETVNHVEQILRDKDAQTELSLATTARTLAARILETFPTTTTPAVTHPGRLIPNTLRQAIDFMEANARIDIGVWDIARAVDLTPSGVAYLFRRHLGVTPMAHLRQIRLRNAHQELVDGDPAATTVGRVAARWGFARPGSFAALYRTCYAQSPYATLRG